MGDLTARVHEAVNRLCKWRAFFAAWEHGTQGMAHGPTNAVKNHHERTIMLRAEMNAVTRLLIDKGVFTIEEFHTQLIEEANELEAGFQRAYPGIKAHPIGLDYKLPEAAETMKRLGFPA